MTLDTFLKRFLKNESFLVKLNIIFLVSDRSVQSANDGHEELAHTDGNVSRDSYSGSV